MTDILNAIVLLPSETKALALKAGYAYPDIAAFQFLHKIWR